MLETIETIETIDGRDIPVVETIDVRDIPVVYGRGIFAFYLFAATVIFTAFTL